MQPLVSVIIVNHNGKKWLRDCLASISKQSYKKLEMIFVDNNSSDKSCEYVSKNFSKVKIVKSKTNLGFAGGNNLGFKHSKGEYLLLLNNDTKIEKNFVSLLMEAFKVNKKCGIVQSKLVLMNNLKIIDSCGSFWTNTTFMYYVGNAKDASLELYNKPFKVFSVKGASVMIKREVIDKIGFFDDDFWNYYEETDFCHRAWLAGYESWYWPKALCLHGLGGTSLTFDNSYIQFHNFKNKLCSFLKNFELKRLLMIVPVFVFFNTLIAVYWLGQRKYKHFLVLIKSIYWNLSNISATLKKRGSVQKLREISDKEFLKVCMNNPRWGYYIHLLNDNLKYYPD